MSYWGGGQNIDGVKPLYWGSEPLRPCGVDTYVSNPIQFVRCFFGRALSCLPHKCQELIHFMQLSLLAKYYFLLALLAVQISGYDYTKPNRQGNPDKAWMVQIGIDQLHVIELSNQLFLAISHVGLPVNQLFAGG